MHFNNKYKAKNIQVILKIQVGIICEDSEKKTGDFQNCCVPGIGL